MHNKLKALSYNNTHEKNFNQTVQLAPEYTQLWFFIVLFYLTEIVCWQCLHSFEHNENKDLMLNIR